MNVIKYKQVENPTVGMPVFVKFNGNMEKGTVEETGQILAIKLATGMVHDFQLHETFVVDDTGRLPTKSENPDGYHKRYNVAKLDGSEVDPGAEYFVLRLDPGADAAHREASIEAILVYAREIYPHNEKMAQEIIDRYAPKEVDRLD